MILASATDALVESIREDIRRSGPISFARFMEHALYHPAHGYYSSDRAVLGRQGDYFTNVSVGAAFGQLFAGQFALIWEALGRTRDFVLVEQGAHHGELARDVLRFLRDQWPDLFATLQYRIVEPFPSLQSRQRETLGEFHEKVEWRDFVEALEPFTGVHFSNELFDALPVHLISSQNDAGRDSTGPDHWAEKRVTVSNDDFAFVAQPVADPALRARLAQLPQLPAGYETEISLAAPRLIRDLSRKLMRGCIVAVDYGWSRARYYSEDRRKGTLQIRAQHTLLESPFTRIGRADITAHVEWTSLIEDGEACGLVFSGLTDQHHFLTGLLAAFPEFAEKASPKRLRELQTLLHPEMLGRTFQVLALSREMSGAPLAGFKFARGPRSALSSL